MFTESCIRKAVRKLQDNVWQGYFQTAELDALRRAIIKRQRERLIDRFKQ